VMKEMENSITVHENENMSDGILILTY